MSELVKKQETSLFKANDMKSAMEIADVLSQTSMVPENYRGEKNKGNIIIALEYANRTGSSPLAIMQNLHVIQGRPSLSSQFIIALINGSGRFEPIKFTVTKTDKKTKHTREFWQKNYKTNKSELKRETVEIYNYKCMAYSTELKSGELLEGPTVSVEMAFLEGWYTKNNSKWPTMMELMLKYRAASFFGRMYCPELLMGMQTDDEATDVGSVKSEVTITPVENEKSNLDSLNDELSAEEEPKPSEPPIDVQTTVEVETEPVQQKPNESKTVPPETEPQVATDDPNVQDVEPGELPFGDDPFEGAV